MEIKTINKMNFLVNGSNLEKFLCISMEEKTKFDLNKQKLEKDSESLKKIKQEFFTRSIVENDIEKICKNCFKNVSTIESLNITAKTPLTIEESAFENCSKLKTIVLDVSGKCLTIQSDAFKSCNELDCVHIKSTGKIIIEKDAFSQCYNLRVVILDSGNVGIRDNAFESSNDLCIISKSDKKGNKKIEKYCSEHNFEYKELI